MRLEFIERDTMCTRIVQMDRFREGFCLEREREGERGKGRKRERERESEQERESEGQMPSPHEPLHWRAKRDPKA